MSDKKIENFVIVRACIGCVLPDYAKLIGSGDFSVFKNGLKQIESYYDYEIPENDLDTFLEVNRYVLLKNQLIDLDKEKKEEKEKEKETINGYTKKS